MSTPSKKSNNKNPPLDFRSTRDGAWYYVDKLLLSKKNTTLTVRFLGFDRNDDEKFNVKDFKTGKELDDFVKRFRPSAVQLQDEECKDVKRFWFVCACLELGEEDQRFYNGFIESIHRELHTIKRGEERCSCTFVVGWLEGPKAGRTENKRLENICKVQLGSPLFDQALAGFVNTSRARLDSVSNGDHLPVKKVTPEDNTERQTKNSDAYL
ncbi:hypothetical protein MKW94_029031 [Papaver nudicaule]|uniref:SAWADEE domain-containing protein n=1 Tax=Papaver nudicaule TaxID=74823 RepID=A0AA41VVP0_PAPNU|nr:hypothetical protein [Papaver nudicaule]